MLRKFACILLCLPCIALGFADDLCFDINTNKMFNCLDKEPDCAPPNDSKSCKLTTTKTMVDSIGRTKPPRSMVHTDATFYIAQAVGIHYDAAHRIAAYDQSIDLGEYVPANYQGDPIIHPARCESNKPPAECKYFTKPLNGLVRTNLATGGSFFHYGALNNPDNLPVNGFNPLKNDPLVENMITNLRSWIYTNNLLCTAGLNGLQAGTCYLKSNGKPGQIFGTLPTLERESHLDLHFKSIIEEQVIHEDETQTVYASDLANYVGSNDAADAKVGIYLHTLQDRISHHNCIDTTSMTRPGSTPGENFVATYPRQSCHQTAHLVWHTWETGQKQAADVPPAQRTLYPALDLTYDELLSYAKSKGMARPHAGDPAYKKAVLDGIFNALQLSTAEQRMVALLKAMDDFKFQRLPGH